MLYNNLNLFMKYYLILLISFFSTSVFAQENDTIPPKYDFIILNNKYINAFTFIGRDFGQTIPLLSTDLMLYSNSGIYLSGSAIKFMDEALPWQYSGSVGYLKDLSKRVDINMSYSRFFVSQSSEVAGIQNLSFLQGTLGLDWTVLYSSIQVQALFNEKNDLFLTTHHSRYFELNQKLFKSWVLSFEPRFSLFAGSSNFYLMGGYDLNPNDLNQMQKMQLLAAEAMLPFTITAGNFEIELHAKYVAPFNLPDFDESRRRMIWGLQLSYALPLPRK
jgi:hypothetical protein